jgi:hypothetical protein
MLVRRRESTLGAVVMDAERNTVRRSLMREVNDRILEVNDQFESREPVGIICECLQAGCVVTITIERGAYDDIREHPGRYVLTAGHELAETSSWPSSRGT